MILNLIILCAISLKALSWRCVIVLNRAFLWAKSVCPTLGRDATFPQAQLNLFTKSPSDTSLKSKEWIEYKPTNQINDTSAINFSITAQSSAYGDLKSSVLNVKLRLTNGDGTPMNEATVAGLQVV